MNYPQRAKKSQKSLQISCWQFSVMATVLLQLAIISANAGKVYDMSDKLFEFIEKHPDKRWFIKFYAPWCHHCQELEPIYNNAAESLYRSHNNLVVAKVDCIKYKDVCHHYGVDGFPTLIYLDGKNQHKYQGERAEKSMVAFVDRLQGPTVNKVKDCQALESAIQRNGLIILSTIKNSTSKIQIEFELLAAKYKSTHWFYEYLKPCKSLQLLDEGIWVLKQHLKRPIKYHPSAHLDNQETIDLKADIVQWLSSNSLPIYGQISYGNINRNLALGKTLIIAVLDEYKPSRQLTKSSQELHKTLERIAIEFARDAKADEELLFGWCSDLNLIQYITIYTKVSTPNVIVVKRDLSYHLMLQNVDSYKSVDSRKSSIEAQKSDYEALSKLSEGDIRALVDKAKGGTLELAGGDSYLQSILRSIMDNVRKLIATYHANPLLMTLIFGLPCSIIIFVVYTTCFYEGGAEGDKAYLREEDEGFSDYEYSEGEEDGLVPQGDTGDHLHQD